jgi:acetylornithine deacetylase
MHEPLLLTERLVSVDTVSARPNAPIIAELTELLQGLGAWTTVQQKPDDPGQVNLIGRLGPAEGAGGLLLAGHTDTVPWDESMRATTAPERDGRRLFGRGTCDMKGAIAAMVCAAQRVDAGALRKPVWFGFTFQEEIGCLGAKELAHGPLSLPVEHCIIGEPTGLRPVTRHKGYAIARVHLRGVPCHSSDPDQGVNAIHAGARAVDALLALAERWKRRDVPAGDLRPPWTTLNIGVFDGGVARNMVPERAAFTVEVRPLPGLDPGDLLSEVEQVARAASETVPGIGFRFERVEADEPLFTADDEALVRWLVERTGSPPSTVPFYTEGAIFTAMGARTVICGPGEIAQAHRVDEWVEIDALEQAAVLYRAAIEEFCT